MGHVAPALAAGTLSEALKKRTWALHTAAERSGIINDILRKKADRLGYLLLLRNVVPAYREMEQALERHRLRPAFRAFARPELYRLAALEADLSALHGADWARDLALLPAAERYAAQIVQAGQGDGMPLVAHAYVRYFGDLSGGQILKRLLGQALQLPESALNFYEFPAIADAAAFKTAMRESIDGEIASHCEWEVLIAEAKRAFEHNIAVSKAVQEFIKAAA
jgi:heme oxygenase